MSRIPELQREELDAEGQRLYDEILTARGSTAGPFRVWLHSPEFVRRATQLGEFLRYHTDLLPRLSELIILITARLQESDVEWAIHEPLAPKAGLRDDVIEALRNRGRPTFDSDEERAIYDYSEQLHRTHTIDEETLHQLIEALGKKAAVEVIGPLRSAATPSFTVAEERAMFDFCEQLHRAHTVEEETFRQLVATLGNKAAVEVTAPCGSTPMVAMTLNAFGIGTLGRRLNHQK
jgi:4-carboxymuconolactone decarboxylase